MKEIVKISSDIKNLSARELLIAVTGHFIIALAGFAATKAIVMDKLLPFGLSFLAGSSLIYTPSVAAGVFLGYFIPAVGNGGFRYIAALFAILAVKFLLSSFQKLLQNSVFLSLMAFFANFAISIIVLKGLEANILDAIIESLLCAAATYFISQCFKAFQNCSVGLSNRELSEMLITVSFLLMGLIRLELIGISLGRLSCFILILIASKYGGISAGAVSGVTVALTLSLSGISGNIGVSIAFSGLMAGIFSHLGKYVQASVVLIFVFLGSVTTADTMLISRTVIEAALGCAFFLLIPRNTAILFSKIFSSQPKLYSSAGLKKSITMRLDLASNALKDVSVTVERVSKQLSRINAPDFGTVISAIEQDACSGCKLRVHCWESRRDDTLNAILEMTKAVKQGESAPEGFAPEEFKGRCMRPAKVGNCTYKRYSDYTSRIAAENRIEDVRSVISDQFDGISSMLSDLSNDFENEDRFDNVAAENLASALKNIGIRVSEAGCRIDKFGRMTVEFKVKKTPELVINKLGVMKTVSIVCERDFDIPNVSEVGGEIFVILNEHAEISIDFGVEQISASNSTMCGDAYKRFYDGRGHFIMILSDGMGTGGRAAVDGAMASGLMARLLKAGFGYDCSLRILNSSMLFKSTDESLATVDIASIDLYTGQTYLYKAGAAPTIIRRSGKTGKAESTSLPAGILREINFDKGAVKCRFGDIIVLMSDGASSCGTDWIREEIEAWQDGSAKELAERLCECARRRRTDKHEDDITVMAAILNKAI